jgi:hypothetical protein
MPAYQMQIYFGSSFLAIEKSTTIAGSTGLSITPRSTALSMASLNNCHPFLKDEGKRIKDETGLPAF